MTTLAAASPGQINLYNPSLIPKREHFSARQIAAGVVVALLAMIAVAWWASAEMRTLRRAVAEQEKLRVIESARALAPPMLHGEAVPTPQEVAALEKALGSQQALVATRRAARDALKRGMAGPEAGPSALMRLLARTVPPQAWVTEVRAVGGRLDLTGKTLDPAAVDAWLDRLRASGLLADRPLPTMRVERIEAAAPSGLAASAYLFNISAALSHPFADDGARP
jgi:Tfp pilus assembly protein PilN